MKRNNSNQKIEMLLKWQKLKHYEEKFSSRVQILEVKLSDSICGRLSHFKPLFTFLEFLFLILKQLNEIELILKAVLRKGLFTISL